MTNSQQPRLLKYPDGSRHWILDDQLHRLDGPAAIEPDGTEKWYRFGKLHREDGPAILNKSDIKNSYLYDWFLNGQRIPLESFTRSSDPVQQCLDFQRFAIIYLIHNF